MLLAHDVRAAQGGEGLLWGLGAGVGAVRAIAATPTRLAAAADDGNVLVYEF